MSKQIIFRRSQFTRLRVILLLTLLPVIALHAEEIDLNEILRNPSMANYKGYAEFKMAHYDNARKIWQALAERGNAEASFNLGVLYEDGLGVSQSLAQALLHYETAAIDGSFKAQYRLGLIYFVGKIVPEDKIKAKRWLTEAALGGDKDSIEMLKILNGTSNSQRDEAFLRAETAHASGDYIQAANIWQRLANDNDIVSRTRLAWLYEKGLGVKRDLKHAAKLFRQSAMDGDADAQYALAVMLQTGKGQVQDIKASKLWLQSAADLGHQAAALALVNTVEN
ncbi:sel1 repeat family protein [Colwellia sp. MB02u-10]|uniref:tetratricopeptide repeat protein n=1 Tax=Colwellia sp. MB02u-10 TaxID=2759828 RepID=UPI0015F3EF8D|nr:tetratricopeptide repeat protein [Colwellia sp. MB02u-10]MBA6342539.1 sel1 repeat family protein [Colwellia sp. MB02u-10]